jgi:1-deoxy-D-xylulose-5-phosphate synthase
MIVTHASVFGHTNGTHVGLLDMTLLGNIPNLVYLAPTNFEEYMAMLDWSIDQKNSPVAIRVPWTTVHHTTDHLDSDYSKEEYKIVEKGFKVAILALGSFYQLGESVARRLLSFAGIKPTLINPRFITGIDSETLKNLKKEHNLVVTIEDGILSGGFGSRIAQFYSLSRMRVMNCGFSMDIPDRYDANELMKKNRLTVDDIVSDIANIEKRQMQNCRGFKR